jgi:hypothetical protein
LVTCDRRPLQSFVLPYTTIVGISSLRPSTTSTLLTSFPPFILTPTSLASVPHFPRTTRPIAPINHATLMPTLRPCLTSSNRDQECSRRFSDDDGIGLLPLRPSTLPRASAGGIPTTRRSTSGLASTMRSSRPAEGRRKPSIRFGDSEWVL